MFIDPSSRIDVVIAGGNMNRRLFLQSLSVAATLPAVSAAPARFAAEAPSLPTSPASSASRPNSMCPGRQWQSAVELDLTIA